MATPGGQGLDKSGDPQKSVCLDYNIHDESNHLEALCEVLIEKKRVGDEQEANTMLN